MKNRRSRTAKKPCASSAPRLYEVEMERQHEAMAKERKQQVGSGDRSEKIRTYNFPQNRLYRSPYRPDHPSISRCHGRPPASCQ